jgi:hypothetical protein
MDTTDRAMSRQYNPKTVLRHVPNHLLREFFDRRGQLRDLPWISLKDHQFGLIYDAWQSLPAAERAEVERAFRSVFDMACEAGIKALIEEGRFHGVGLAVELERCDGLYHKAMWAYLRHERIFKVAALFCSADSLPGRHWAKLSGLPKKTPDTSEDARRRLADGLSEYFRENQGRGHRCTVESFFRGGRQHYFFAYPDDYTETYIGHADDGTLVKRPQKKAFEVVFVYAPAEGTLDLYVWGDRKVRARVAYTFSNEILGENLPPERVHEHTYELDGLSSRGFAFPTDPEDGIGEVRVQKMRLSVAGNARRRITLEADPQGPVHDIYYLMEEYLDGRCMAPGAIHVTHATIRLKRDFQDDLRPRFVTLTVSFPNSSNLKGLAEDDRLLGEKYLKRWGIDRA